MSHYPMLLCPNILYCLCTTSLYSCVAGRRLCLLHCSPLSSCSPSRPPTVVIYCDALPICLSVVQVPKPLLSNHLCVDCSILCYSYIKCDANDSLFYGQSPHVT
ncbi:hypothetical protein JOB18_032689 [Solea senegalensis]|uniref:Secreted protein n=1 Tax=Solea senegalensis TaxID=28829 RepID=A0AAV6S9F0_SOLSE|nr:hypothetical protein JOB18_032689 [Solea senegalensis]